MEEPPSETRADFENQPALVSHVSHVAACCGLLLTVDKCVVIRRDLHRMVPLEHYFFYIKQRTDHLWNHDFYIWYARLSGSEFYTVSMKDGNRVVFSGYCEKQRPSWNQRRFTLRTGNRWLYWTDWNIAMRAWLWKRIRFTFAQNVLYCDGKECGK